MIRFCAPSSTGTLSSNRIVAFVAAVALLGSLTCPLAGDDYLWIGEHPDGSWDNSHDWENLSNGLEPEIDDGTFSVGRSTATIDDTATGYPILVSSHT